MLSGSRNSPPKRLSQNGSAAPCKGAAATSDMHGRMAAREPEKRPARYGPLGATECNRAGNRSRPGAHGVPIIAALNDPLAVLVAYDPSDMMGPHHDGADGGAARVCSIARPGASQIEGRARVASDLPAHVPPTPGARATGVIGAVTMMVMGNMTVMMMTVVSAMAMMVRPRLRRRCACTKHCRCHYKVTKHESPRFGKRNRSAERAEIRGERIGLNFAERNRAKLNRYYRCFQPA